jgi:hypothetical protein
LAHAGSSSEKERSRENDRLPRDGTLRCDGCGEEFVIGHKPQSMDKRVAEKKARWLEKVLVEEHERDGKHSDRIELLD